MIRTIAELLNKIVEKEKQLLDDFDISHGPTIGDMYEGLTRDVLGKVIPQGDNISVVKGFIIDDTNVKSRQIDCMIVKGKGKKIPYTDAYKYHIKDVIAIFEIKKTLYSADLEDSYNLLKDVLDIFRNNNSFVDNLETTYVSSVLRAFERITRIHLANHQDKSNLSMEYNMIYNTLLIERFSPIRIVVGYDGFQSEYSFRDKMMKLLKKNIGKRGFGVLGIPQLCISGKYSIVKANGQPYMTNLDNGWWNYLLSSNISPIHLILELIWTRLSYDYNLNDLWGNDFEIENLNPFIQARFVNKEDVSGWDYNFINIKNDSLKESPQYKKIKPLKVSLCQYIIFNILCEKGKLSIHDDLFSKIEEVHGCAREQLIESLLSTHLISIDKNNILRLSTTSCDCLIHPDGYYIYSS